MKDIKIKYSLIALSYLFLIFLIIISYVSIIPEEDLPVLENTKSLIKEEKGSPISNENTVYEILEKKAKTIEEIIEKEVENKQKFDLEKNNDSLRKFRIQVASFKEKKKSLEVSKKLKKEFSSEKFINFEIKQIVLKNNDIFFRVINYI